MSKLPPIQIGYGGENITFYLRMISVEEEDRYAIKLNDISDSNATKYQERFDIYKDALGEFSIEVPTNGKDKPLVKDASASEAIQQHFKERTNENERIIRAAYVMFRTKLDPEVSFL